MDEIDIPRYFLCPISLQIMKDPVTTVTGITYDRESIELWLITAEVEDESVPAAMCPVTKQPLPRGSDLTPNHMLRRLIQAWCIANAKNGVDRIPTPKSTVQRSLVLKLVRDLNKSSSNNNNNSLSTLRVNGLKKMDELAKESEKNQKCMAEAGVPKAMVFFIMKCFREGKISCLGLEEALRILQLTCKHSIEFKHIVEDNLDFIQSILWVLKDHNNNNQEIRNFDTIIPHALAVLKKVTEVASSNLIETLSLDLFKQIVNLLRNSSPQITRAALHILIQTCPFGRNKIKIIESGAVFELIEIELTNPEKKTSELVFCVLAHLCSCADGRQQFLKHAGGLAVAAKRLLRVSPATDDRALCVLESIARFSATREVVVEMLRVGVVSKLCMVLQADCAFYLKKKAREVLRLHSGSWSGSPCIQVYLLTRYTR
ncbi:hypothetical protein ACJIZ3_017421 [Penstemon smallii]|uniref:U-box domain-containing protein n=1 Tax=Penstemon smallii TaxID=265156 RepID=A0ABD3SVI0_9LAMI